VDQSKSTEKSKIKKQAWQRYLASKEGADYNLYIEARNVARKEVWKSVKLFEKSLAKKCKTDPKAFWAYAKSKSKLQSTLKQLRKGDRLIFDMTQKRLNS
jgi:hypothetical protein